MTHEIETMLKELIEQVEGLTQAFDDLADTVEPRSGQAAKVAQIRGRVTARKQGFAKAKAEAWRYLNCY